MSKALEALRRLENRRPAEKRPPIRPPNASERPTSTPETYPRSRVSAWREILAAGGDDRRELFEERAAIMEHDGGLSREEAEERAGLWAVGPLVSKAFEVFEDLVVVEVNEPNRQEEPE